MYVCVDPRLCVYFLAHGEILVHVCFDVQTGVCLETKKCVCVCVCVGVIAVWKEQQGCMRCVY